MGYNTRYTLSYVGADQLDSAAIELAKETIDEGYDPFEEGCRWYDHDVDMRNLSREYPTLLFTLEGEGEEAGDLWKKYYNNGRVQVAKAKITFDEFDEKKLK